MAIHANWKLPERLEALSTTQWPQALKEWKLKNVTLLSSGEESMRCLCGHTPIRELCKIRNTVNGNETILGNHCIELVTKDSRSDSGFSSVPKIIQAGQRIMVDPSKSANLELIDFAHDEHVITDWERDFYIDIRSKRKLTKKQLAVKERVNAKLVDMLTPSPSAMPPKSPVLSLALNQAHNSKDALNSQEKR
jgi:hypothetical protein